MFTARLIAVLAYASLGSVCSAQTLPDIIQRRYDDLWLGGAQRAVDIEHFIEQGYLLFIDSREVPPDGSSVHLLVTQLTSNGDRVNEHRYPTPEPYMHMSPGYLDPATQLADGSYLYASTVTDSASMRAALLMRFNTLGDTLWTRVYEATSGSYTAIKAFGQPDGGVLLFGWHQMASMMASSNMVIRTDAAGNELWRTDINPTPMAEGAQCVTQMADGSYLLAGSLTPSVGQASLWYCKVNDQGQVLWHHSLFGNSSTNTVRAIAPCASGGYIMAGLKGYLPMIASYYPYRHCFLRIDENGDTLWTRTYGCTQLNSMPNSILELPDGTFLMAGLADGTPCEPFHEMQGSLMAISSTGDSLAYQHVFLADSADPECRGGLKQLLLDTANQRALAVGWASFYPFTPYWQDDAWLLGFPWGNCSEGDCLLGSAAFTGIPVKESPSTIQIHPNPTEAELTIATAASGTQTLVVRDVSGRIIHRSRPTGNTKLDVTDWPAGTYVVEIIGDDLFQAHAMFVVQH
jgi:hypothetical protein